MENATKPAADCLSHKCANTYISVPANAAETRQSARLMPVRLIAMVEMVGATGFEPVTPAV